MALNRKRPLQRSSKIRPRSKKTERTYTKRRALVAELLRDQPVCQRCHSAAATDVHEILSRARGGSILDLDNLAVLCRPCHSWITTHPALATEEGWLTSAWNNE